jgi:hypothetical protein
VLVVRQTVHSRMTNGCLFIALSFAVPAISLAQLPRVRDSAGVHIVENSARSKAPIAFRLSDKASFDVGGLKANPDDELDPRGGYLRSIALSNGTYVVDDDSKLRYLDATGKQFRVTGRTGAGPNEFRQISTLCRTHGDTVVASDPSNGRITVLDKTGSIVKQVAVGRAEMPYDGCFSDGTWVLWQSGMGPDSTRRARMAHYNLDGAVIGSSGDYWGGKFDLFVSVSPTFIVRGTHLYVGDPRASEVRIYDQNGKLTGIIRTDDPIAKTTASEQAAMMPQAYPMSSDQSIMDRFKERLRTTPRPGEWPSYGRIAVDPEGRLWIQDYQKARTDPVLWTAFDASGRLLGKLSFPPSTKPSDARLVDFTSGGVQVRREDSDGAPHLTIYPLVPVRGGRP